MLKKLLVLLVCFVGIQGTQAQGTPSWVTQVSEILGIEAMDALRSETNAVERSLLVQAVNKALEAASGKFHYYFSHSLTLGLEIEPEFKSDRTAVYFLRRTVAQARNDLHFLDTHLFNRRVCRSCSLGSNIEYLRELLSRAKTNGLSMTTNLQETKVLAKYAEYAMLVIEESSFSRKMTCLNNYLEQIAESRSHFISRKVLDTTLDQLYDFTPCQD